MALALFAGALVAAPWRGWAAVGFGLVALLPLGDRSRVALIAAGGAFVLDRFQVEVAVLLGLGVVLGSRVDDEERPWRHVVAAVTLGAGALIAAKQVLGATLLTAAAEPVASVVWMAVVAASFIATSADTVALGRGLVLAGVLALASGQWLAAQLPGLPLEAAASAVHERRAWRQQPALRKRAIVALSAGAPAGYPPIAAVVAIDPRDRALGEALVGAWGADAALEAGWQPRSPLSPGTAVAAAWGLERRGQLGRAVQLLREHPRHGEVAWALSLLAGELGEGELASSSWPRATPPAEAARAPAVVLDGQQLVDGRPVSVFIGVEEPVEALLVSARATAWKGNPRLEIRLGALRWELEVPPAGGQWELPAPLSEAAYRLRVRLVNDASGIGGDRNIHALRVELR